MDPGAVVLEEVVLVDVEHLGRGGLASLVADLVRNEIPVVRRRPDVYRIMSYIYEKTPE